jgi:hypothetical protein
MKKIKETSMSIIADKYIEKLRISSSSIDKRRDIDRRLGFVAGWKGAEEITNTYIDLFENCNKRLNELIEENDRLKNLIEKMYVDHWRHRVSSKPLVDTLRQFKQDNNL